MGTRRCDGSISEDARNIPANTPLRQRMELLVKTAEKEKKKQWWFLSNSTYLLRFLEGSTNQALSSKTIMN